MDRWVAFEQQKADRQLARSRERYQLISQGRPATWLDRWGAHEQRKADAQLAHGRVMSQLAPLVPREAVQGPDWVPVRVTVGKTGCSWLDHLENGPGGPGFALGGVLGFAVAAVMLAAIGVTMLIWRYAFHQTYTVHARAESYPPVQRQVRLPGEAMAYRYAAGLVGRIQAEGAAALDGLPDVAAEPA